MKYRYLLIGFLSTLALSCTVSEIDSPEGQEGYISPERETFYVSIDEQPGTETKVYADPDLQVLWNKDDRISIFNKSTYNREYCFTGEDGENSGEIVAIGKKGSGDKIDRICAVYPYQESTSINSSGEVSFELPAVQYYKENSFGLKANTMVSVSAPDDSKLRFKNVGGYLALMMYGSNVKVSSIILRGNNDEDLSGPSTIEMTEDGPTVSIDGSEDTKQIRLYCKEIVELGSSWDPEDCTIFWIVVPPVDFSQGFNVTVATPDGKTCTKSTSKHITIDRSTVTRLAPFEVVPTGSINASITEVKSTWRMAKSDGGSQDKTKTATLDNGNFTIQVPTATDFSNVTFNYVYSRGAKLMANGKEIHNGEYIQDSGLETTLTVCIGDAEKRYTLKVENTGLPVVRITTDGFDRSTVEGDAEHETWYGYDKDVPANSIGHAYIRIDMPDGSPGMINKDGEDEIEIETQIKGRGNASWGYPKRPYALKLNKKIGVRVQTETGDQIVLPVHKRWILLANWKDITLLRNDAAFWLSAQTDLPYTVRGQFVELVFNGEHRGNYYLCEQIKIDPGRVDIAEMDENETGATTPNNITGGYLMEIDNNWDDKNSFTSEVFNFKYQFKQPDEKERSQKAYDYMTSFINRFETSVYNLKTDTNSPYKNYLDIDSAIWFMFVNELTGNGDFFNTDSTDPTSTWYGPHSTYFYKDRIGVRDDLSVRDSTLHMGPVWDLDYHTFMTKDQYGNDRIKWVGVDQPRYYYRFMLNDPEFKRRMLDLWGIYSPGLSDAFEAHVTAVANKIRVSEGYDYEMWWKKTGDQKQNIDSDLSLPSNNNNYQAFNTAVARIKLALRNKLTYINSNIGNLSYTDPEW